MILRLREAPQEGRLVSDVALAVDVSEKKRWQEALEHADSRGGALSCSVIV